MATTHHGPATTQVGAARSEGSVVLLFCAALGVALGTALLQRATVHADHGDAPHAEAQVGKSRVAEGRRHAVAAAAPEASEAALQVLADGGNAADALVTASFVMAVVRPQSTGIGGGGFVLHHDAKTRTQTALDGRERAPAEARENMYLDSRGEPTSESRNGPRSAGVPGLVAMLWRLHQDHGSKKLDWARLVAPAIALAENGFAVPESLARAVAERRKVLAEYPASAAVFLPNGRPLQAGDRFVQADLASTLKEIAARGGDGFYQGAVARRLVEATRARGGHLSIQDLAGYEVKARTPVRGTYRGHEVVSMPPPSSGGVHLVQMLNILSGYDLEAMGWHSAEHLHVLAEAMRRAYADRAEHLGDPDHVAVPVKWLTDPAYAEELRKGIALDRATPSSELHAGRPAGPERPHTTHISVIDADGNVASSTQTVNLALGSGFVAEGTGVLLNDEMDDFAAKPGAANAFGLVQGAKNAIQPGKRPLSSMTPTIVFGRDGAPLLVVGSPGGSKIITTVLQTISNVIDFGMSLERAVAAPRVHHQWKPDELVLEPGIDRAVLDGLSARGHIVRVVERLNQGEVQAIHVKPQRRLVAVSDPRGEGRPAAN